MSLQQCRECGMQVSTEAQACPHCGAPVRYSLNSSSSEPVLIKSKKSRGIAVLLAFLLGGLGIHKFYLDKPGIGVLYLLFCWTWIPAIISIFEGIGYLLMSD
jgi:hypothetical protein